MHKHKPECAVRAHTHATLEITLTTGELITAYRRIPLPADWDLELIADLFPDLTKVQRNSLLRYIICRRRRLYARNATTDHRRLYVKRK